MMGNTGDKSRVGAFDSNYEILGLLRKERGDQTPLEGFVIVTRDRMPRLCAHIPGGGKSALMQAVLVARGTLSPEEDGIDDLRGRNGERFPEFLLGRTLIPLKYMGKPEGDWDFNACFFNRSDKGVLVFSVMHSEEIGRLVSTATPESGGGL